MRKILFALATVVVAVPGLTQTNPPAIDPALISAPLSPSAIASAGIALNVKLGDLTSDWLEIHVGSGPSDSPAGVLASLYGGQGREYYTQGRAVPLGADVYLLAYGRPGQQPDLVSMMRGSTPKADPLTPDTTLNLSILNLRTVGSITDIQAFDLQREISESAVETRAVEQAYNPSLRTSAGPDTAQGRLKQLAVGVRMYMDDYDDVFPPMKSVAQLKKAVNPYVRSRDAFVAPGTGEPFRANTRLSGAKGKSVKRPSETVLLYQFTPDRAGQRAVAFVDGHVEMLDDSRWTKLKRASGIR